ncbi:4-aminobutyrate aminotransferase [Methylobacterium sp. E-045]|uniref:4-aminobutyrate aminotransferase n=1 Tax=Methylobacterium sp. E-045 TaxID=2836575 RepID=UPI001FB99209|nr:4-aminobutyrate aminotransferase [Methylobacterium sp. E-045]MCJ2132054.1 4-aminobutyrate aminotransferase [Methylobacterium sp. E-045]
MYAAKSNAFLAAGLFLAIASAPVLAQDTATRTETAAPGKSVRILIASNLKDDCKPGSMPEIRISTSPKNGSLITKTGSVTTPASHKCPNKKTAATGVFYQSKDGFTGTDEVVVEVKKADGKTMTQTINITVGGSATKGGDDTKKGATDL